VKRILMVVLLNIFIFLAARGEPIQHDAEFKVAFDSIATLIDSLKDARHIPGLSVAVVYDQEMIWAKGFGYANVDKKIPATSKTIYRIASITKLFTMTMLMQLRDKGELQLDDPLIKYLPGFKIKNPFAGTRPITLRQIACHASGLPREAPLNYMETLNFPTIEEIMATLPNTELIFPPLEKFKYSNLGVGLLGHALEIIAEKPYRDYIRWHILNPLKMKYTDFRLTPEMKHYYAVGYIFDDNNNSHTIAPQYDMRGLSPAGQLYTNAEDISKFIAFQFHEPGTPEDSVLNHYSLREMRNIEIIDSNWKIGMGIGWALTRMGDETLIGHSGGTHGYTTNIFLIPDLKIGVAVFANSTNADPGKISKEILRILVPAIRMMSSGSKEQKISPYQLEAWKKFVGSYVWKQLGQRIEIKLVKNRLIVTSPDSPGLLIRLSWEKERTFRMKGGPFDGELLIFHVDETGKVFKACLGNYCFEKEI